MNFEWEENKNQINQRKHGISFEEAQAVLEDEHAILFDDPDHSESEERFLLIGLDRKTRVCITSMHRKSLLSRHGRNNQDHLCKKSDQVRAKCLR